MTSFEGASSEGAHADALRRLHALVGKVVGELDLGRTLELVCQGVVDGLGFEVAVVNLVRPDGDLEVVAVAGSDDAHAALHGTRAGRAEWEQLLAACTPVGRLRLGYDHDDHPEDMASWVPDRKVADDPDAWHPLDELYAPLETSSYGLMGVLSVDLPRDGLRPGWETLELLEVFAAHACIALENATLHSAQQELVGRLSALVSEAPIAIVELDLDGLVREWNPEAERLFGWSRDEVVGRRNPAVGDEEYGSVLQGLDAGRSTHRQLVRRRRRDGSSVDVEKSDKVLRDVAGRSFGYLGAYVDVSERVALEAELRAAAFTDPLTGTANRARFRERLDALAASGEPGWLLLLDLDGFKSVNDTLGHGTGDQLLVEVALRLRTACRGDDLPARLGGDEFVVLLRSDQAAAERLAARLVTELSRPYLLAERSVVLGCSIGLAPVQPGDAGGALREADIAMYAAKANGKGRYEVFADALGDAALDRADLVADLRRALDRDELFLRWHPIVSARSGGVVGMEALVRWQHPQRGELLPAVFVGLAEETGLVVALGEQVLRAACAQLRRWQRLPHCEQLSASVNLSPVQVRHPQLVQQVRAALADSGVRPDRLVLELTEDVLVSDLDAAVAVLHELKALGVRLALDDFGAGYSSLRYLRTLPVDIVKLDRALLDGVPEDEGARALLGAVVGLVRTIGCRPVVEGVETVAQHDVVRALDADLLQGFLFARPLLPADAERVLEAGWPSSPVPTLLPRPREGRAPERCSPSR